MKKKIFVSLISLSVIFVLALTFVSAASKTKNVSGSCQAGSFSESITINVTLSNANNPSYEYTNRKYNTNIGYRTGGVGHETKVTKKTSDHFVYKNTATASWIDYNYINYKTSDYVTFDYKGSLT